MITRQKAYKLRELILKISKHLGAKVSHLNKHWISDYDNNIWEPSIFGWSEV